MTDIISKNSLDDKTSDTTLVNVSFESLIFPNKILPPCFYNGNLSESLKDIYDCYENDEILHDNFEWQGNKIKKFYGYQDISTRVIKGVEPINFVSEKPSGGSRIFSIAHPLVQIPLHKYILTNVETILNKQMEEQNNYCSNSKYYYEDGDIYVDYDYNGNELLSSGLDTLLQKKYKDSILKKHILSNGKYYKLYLDISNFFHSIYTHTISWNVDESEKDIFDNLDMLMRTQNNNETKGIIIGPYTSGLFAEILMSKIDYIMMEYIKHNNLDVSYVRYVDDIEMYSDDKNILYKCLFMLEKELLKYKLDINNNKTSVDDFPFLQLITKNSKSIYQLKEKLIGNSYEDNLEKIEDIIMEINNSLSIGHSNTKYLFSIIRNLIKNENILEDINAIELNILLDYLLNILFKYPILTENTSLLILSILKDRQDIDADDFINKMLNKRIARQHTLKEITDIWITYIITYLNVLTNDVEKYFNDVLGQNDICSLMIIDYYHKNSMLLEKKNVIVNYLNSVKENLKNKYDTNWKSASWLSKYWLLFYLNETKWEIDVLAGYGASILAEVRLNELFKDNAITQRLNIFKIMVDLNIELLNYNNER